MSRNLFGLLLLLFSGICNAGSGWSQTGTVVEVYNLGFTVMVKLSGDNKDYSELCGSKLYYAIDTSDTASFNSRFSQILMAHASGKQIKFWIDGNKCSGQGGSYQTIESVKTF